MSQTKKMFHFRPISRVASLPNPNTKQIKNTLKDLVTEHKLDGFYNFALSFIIFDKKEKERDDDGYSFFFIIEESTLRELERQSAYLQKLIRWAEVAQMLLKDREVVIPLPEEDFNVRIESEDL